MFVDYYLLIQYNLNNRYLHLKPERILQLIGEGHLGFEIDQRYDSGLILGHLSQIVLQRARIANSQHGDSMVDGILNVPLTATGDEQFHLGVRCNESK